jgi:hypothetical protein
MRGEPKIQGSYADFSLVINLCHLLGLFVTAEALSQLASAYNPERQGQKDVRGNLLSQDKRPLVATQPRGILTQPWLANDVEVTLSVQGRTFLRLVIYRTLEGPRSQVNG